MTTMTITYDRRNKAARAIVETLPKLHSRVGSPVYSRHFFSSLTESVDSCFCNYPDAKLTCLEGDFLTVYQ
jgi:hypothetical protein